MSEKTGSDVAINMIFNSMSSILTIAIGIIVVNLLINKIVNKEIVNKSICYLMNTPIKGIHYLFANVTFITIYYFIILICIFFSFFILSKLIFRVTIPIKISILVNLLMAFTTIILYAYIRIILSFTKYLKGVLGFLVNLLPFLVMYFGFSFFDKISSNIQLIIIITNICLLFISVFFTKKINKRVIYLESYSK